MKLTGKLFTVGRDMKLKFVYWFAFYNPDSPTVRYRGKYVLDYLQSNYGINSYFVFPDYTLSRIIIFLRSYFSALLFPEKDSLIIIQSVYSNFFYANALKFLVKIRKKNSIYDLDDADYLRYSPDTIYYFIQNCSAVTVGSAELLKNISSKNKKTILIPCPTPDLNIIKQKRNELLTLGWIGHFSEGHKESLLKFFFPALINLPFKVKLHFLGVPEKQDYIFLMEYFSNFEKVILEIPQDIVWENEKDIQQRISNFDIGIATLLNTEFYRSKSAFKTKQCFNNGVPVLSTDVPENNLFVEHGKNGFLCSSPAEFRQRIIEIKEMSNDNYDALSTYARNTIVKFNLNRFCNDLLNTYENMNQEKFSSSKN